MKKGLIATFIAVIVCVALCFSGCGIIASFFGGGTTTNDSGSKSSNSKLATAPKVNAYGNVITWNSVSNADSYEICKNGVFSTSTELTHYVFDNLNNDISATVKAVSGSKKSDESNKVSVDKISGFSENEIKSISIESGNEYSIESEIRCLKVSGTAINCGFTIDSDRTHDLVIELDNVNMTSSKNNNCFRVPTNEFNSAKIKFSVIFVVKGSNTLTGYSQTEVPAPQTETNSGKTGTHGLDGRSPIVLPEIVINGSGTLTLKGGKGGDGGEGAPSSGAWATFYGDGGDGGEGGSGIKCTTLVLAMESGGKVISSGSAGGKGGNHGVNGNITTGLLGSVTSSMHNGESGADGKALVGELIQIGGTFN